MPEISLSWPQPHHIYYIGKVCCQLTGSSDFTLKSLLPVNWQQRFYDEMAAAS